jgi:diguanylate cyclase (GGDEF)-like protein/PAS domain S-box-containing protein
LAEQLEDLQRENAFLRRILECTTDSVLAVNGGGRITLSNAAASRAFGYSPEEFRSLEARALFPADDPGGAAQVLAALARRESWSGDAIARRRDGATFPVRLTLSCAAVLDGAAGIVRPDPAKRDEGGTENPAPMNWAILHVRDIADEQRVLDRLKQLSIVDDLTGLYNARYFWARLRYEFVRSVRYQQPLSCLMADLDRFKLVNDAYGHLSGDAALRFVSKILSHSVRQVDILARYGGEEFAVILPSTAEEGALKCAEKIRLAVAQTALSLGETTIRLTASFGVAAATPDLRNEEQLARRADEALLQAKRFGRNRVCPWSPDCPKTEISVPPEVPPNS